ncbi:MAG: glutamate racemase [Desulfobacterales bacterium]|jgi:glutamate racemase
MKANKDDAIGIFDSGLGGVSTLGQAMHMLPQEKFIYYGDSGVPPYAFMTASQIRQRCHRICDGLVAQRAKAIVIACNTATSAALEDLKRRYDIPVLGIMPAVEAAVVQGGSGKILLLATEFTIQSQTLRELIEQQGADREIEMRAPREMIDLVESGTIDGPQMDACIRRFFEGLDTGAVAAVAFGCTHLGFLSRAISNVLGPDIHIADGNEEIVGQLIQVLNTLGLRRAAGDRSGEVDIANSGGAPYVQNAWKMLQVHLHNLTEIASKSEINR